jgi:hypothetical protein
MQKNDTRQTHRDGNKHRERQQTSTAKALHVLQAKIQLHLSHIFIGES